MRLRSFTAHHMGPFEDVHVDFESLGPEAKLVALVGPIGVGKSSIVEMAGPGAFYRETPTRGSLMDLAWDSSSYIESSVFNGAAWTIRHTLDPNSKPKASEAVVIAANGQPAFGSSKVTAFDRWAAKHLPAKDVFLSGPFQAQGSGGILKADTGERRAIILRILGVERIERLAEKAREHGRSTLGQIDTLTAQIVDETARTGKVEDLQLDLDAAQAESAGAVVALKAARSALEAARGAAVAAELAQREAEAARARRDDLATRIAAGVVGLAELERAADVAGAEAALTEAQERARQAEVKAAAAREGLEMARAAARAAEQAAKEQEALRARRAEIETRISAGRAKLANLEERVRNNRAVLADADRIRAAVDRLRMLDAEVLLQQMEHHRLAGEAGARRDGAEQHRRAASVQDGLSRDAGARAAAARAKLADRERVEKALADLPALEDALQRAQSAEVEAAAALETVRGERVAGAEERIGALRRGMEIVASAEDGRPVELIRRHADRVLDEDAAAAKGATEVPVRVGCAEQKLRAAKLAEDAAARELATCREIAARAPLLTEAAAAVEQAESAGRAARDQAQIEREAAAAAEAGATALEADAARAEARIREAHAERETVRPLAARATPLGNAETRIAELTPQVDDARVDLQKLETDLAGTPEPGVPSPPPDVSGPLSAADLAEAEARAAVAACAVSQKAVDDARVAVPRRDAARVDLARLQAELAGVPEPAVPEEPPAVAPLEEAVAAGERRVHDATSAVATTGARLSAAQAAAARVLELEEKRGRLEEHLSDWVKLGEDLGRKGLQNALIDAAGPEITTLANDLLHAAFGPRFSIRLETQRIGADGSLLETFEITVLDTQEGREAPGKTFSGGERVILSEALSLALTTIVCRRSGVERPTIVRDEGAAALDDASARQWVAMLRRCGDLIGVDRFLIVSHSRAVQELCDVRLPVGNRAA